MKGGLAWPLGLLKWFFDNRLLEVLLLPLL